MNRRNFLQVAGGFVLGLLVNQSEKVAMPTRPQITPTPMPPEPSMSRVVLKWGESATEGYLDGLNINLCPFTLHVEPSRVALSEFGDGKWHHFAMTTRQSDADIALVDFLVDGQRILPDESNHL